MVAEGPVVAVCVNDIHQPMHNLIESHHLRDFAGLEDFVTCTLLGSLSQYEVGAGSTKIWSRSAEKLEKVNCMRSNGKYIAVGGFSNGGKGLVEVYGEQIEPQSPT